MLHVNNDHGMSLNKNCYMICVLFYKL